MNACLTQDELTALSRGTLSPEEAARAQGHVDTCPLCYAQLLKGDRPDTGGEETGVLQGGARWAEPSASELNWQPGLDLGRYVILLTLGRGGMGVVFRAYDKELDRAVALKVLHQNEEEGSTTGASSRLLREAQAMARLSHPNVVGVHDVVVLQRRVCVVMELVEGVNVREWLRTEPRRPWKEVVEVFRAAGEGLAAAHDAKLVHRDFKPDNVLVGQDGRARVTDFGIARLASTDPEKVLTPGALKTPANAGTETFHTLSGSTVGGSTLGDTITREGQVVGTPRYMAPEQFEKLPADFRTDQFSFGVALYEALYGQHPFEGKKASEWLEHARRGEVRAPPSASAVPMWIHRLLVRALSADPAGRFPSMRELTQSLGRDPSQRRNRLLVGAGVVAAVVLALVAVGQSLRARAQLCSGSADQLAGVWDPIRRGQLAAAFTATGLPFAEDSSSRAQQVLDAYATRWTTTHQEACLATRIRGEQSDQVLTLRMGCLQQRLDSMAAITDLFARADASTVGKAKQLLDGLPRLETCSDVTRLTARLPPPEDPQAAAEVERIRKELIRSRVLAEAGRIKESGELARPALAAAQKLDHPPVIAEAEANLAVVLTSENRPQEAVELFTTAFAHALALGHDDVLTDAAVRLAAVNVRTRQEKRSLEWATFAESANQRARDPEAAAMVHNARGNVARNGGDFAGAAVHYGKGREEARANLGPEHMVTLGISYNQASALQNLGRFSEARGPYAEVVSTARRTLGPRHPFLAYPLVGSGLVAQYRGESEAARAFFEEVLVITEGKGPNAANAHEALAKLATEQGRYEEAVASLRKARVLTDLLTLGGPETLGTLAQEGLVLLEQGRLEAAWSLFQDVLARGGKMEGAFDAVSDARRGQARILLARGQAAQALPLVEAAVATLITTRGQSHPVTLETRRVAAEVRWALSQREQARKEAEAILAEALRELDPQHPLCRKTRALIEREGRSAR